MIRLLARTSTYWVVRSVGFLALIWYFAVFKDFSFSVYGALAYVALGIITVLILAVTRLSDRFPNLKRYHFHSGTEHIDSAPAGHDKSVSEYAPRETEGLSMRSLFLTPTEDAFICVPVLLVGIGPVSALLGGLIFGFLHLGRYTYFDCIVKAIYYSFVIYFILPYGLLTLIAGHFLGDVIALASLKAILRSKNRM